MAFDLHKNFAYSLVATAPSPAASGTSLTVTAGEGGNFPAVPFNATVWPIGVLPLATNGEVIRVTGIAGDVLTITRTQESSSARTIIVGDQIAATITNKVLTDIETAIPTTAGLLSAINVSAGATSNNLSRISFSNSNGISFGLTGSVITGTVATNYQSQGAYLTTAMLSNAATLSNIKLSGGTLSALRSDVTFGDSNGVSFGLNTNGVLTASVAAAAGGLTNINLSAGTTSNNLSAVTFSNSNGVSFGLNGSVITGTVATNYQSAGAYLTTAALSQDSSKYAFTGFTTATVAGAVIAGTHNTDGLKLAVPAYLTAAGAGAVNFSAGTTSSGLDSVVFSNSNGVSFGLNGSTITGTVATNYQSQGAYLTTAMLSNAATISNVNVSAGTTSNNLSALVFSNSNGVSFGLNGSTVTVGLGLASGFSNFVGAAVNVRTLNAASVSDAIAFFIPTPISASFLRIPVLMTTNSTTILATALTSANASAAIYNTWNAVVYSNGVGASSRSFMSVASGSAQNTFMNSISVATDGTAYSVTQGYSAYAEGNGTTLTTQYSISNTNYSFTTNQIATNFSSQRWFDINFANSLAAGPYWLILGYSSSSAGNSTGYNAMTNCNVRYSAHYGLAQGQSAFGIMGSTNYTSGGLVGAGSFSTVGGGTTNALPISAISSNSSNVLPYFQLLRSA